MSSRSAIILEDTSILAEICGPHDGNLKVIEELFSAPVFTRGNEIIIEANEAQQLNDFATLIEELRRFAREGRDIYPELVRASYESMHNLDEYADLLRDNVVAIPQGYNKVYPRTLNQARFLQGLSTHLMSFGIGPAGSGKTFLAIAHALSEVLSHRKRKLILTRPVVEAGESLGFLPGDLTQKLNPYIKPLYDAMESLVPPEVVTRLEEHRVLEIAPLAYMRGRSLKDAYIILDEAQNTTREQMKMFLTRMGEGSRAVITGDVTQIDLPSSRASGLIHAQRVLKNVPDIHFSYLTTRDVVRSPLVRKIISAYENYENEAEARARASKDDGRTRNPKEREGAFEHGIG